MGTSALQQAIERGLRPGGDLSHELCELDDYSLQSAEDAQAICAALASLPLLRPADAEPYGSSLRALAALFQTIEDVDVPACDVLYEEGIPLLITLFDARFQNGNENDNSDLLFVLKILAMYSSREGTERVIVAARKPLDEDSSMWDIILRMFADEHPQNDYLFAKLSDPFPADPIARKLLSAASEAAFNGQITDHPFDSLEGMHLLRRWLENPDLEKSEYAHAAAVSLPFLTHTERGQLLLLALDHPDIQVQVMGAWASAKIGREAGLRQLVMHCCNAISSEGAQQMLSHLGHEDLIPQEVHEPPFLAMLEFSDWLARCDVRERRPDEIEVVDHRTLTWPPENQLQPFTIVKYCLRDRTGLGQDEFNCGLVGSKPHDFRYGKMDQRPPEDIYAIYCFGEMQDQGLIEIEYCDEADDYTELLAQWEGPPLTSVCMKRVVEIFAELKMPGQLVGLAEAKLAGEEGWVVLDGSRSTWYPKADQPDNDSSLLILDIHIGYQLLGFRDVPDRKQYHRAPPVPRTSAEIVTTYDKLIANASKSSAQWQRRLFYGGVLSSYFDQYVDAKCEITGKPKPDVIIEVYEKLLEAVPLLDESIRDECCQTNSALGECFTRYVDALLSHGRTAEVIRCVQRFAPYWDHHFGYSTLGRAAFQAGDHATAEPFLLLYRKELEGDGKGEEMGMLAEIWFERGNIAESEKLLIGCLRWLTEEIREIVHPPGLKTLSKDFRYYQATFLRLFPQGKDLLMQHGIPESPL